LQEFLTYTSSPEDTFSELEVFMNKPDYVLLYYDHCIG